MLPIVAGALIGAAIGAGKHYLVDKPGEARDRKLAAETARYSPWTGLNPQNVRIRNANLFGSVLKGGALGAMGGAMMAPAAGAAAAAPAATTAGTGLGTAASTTGANALSSGVGSLSLPASAPISSVAAAPTSIGSTAINTPNIVNAGGAAATSTAPNWAGMSIQGAPQSIGTTNLATAGQSPWGNMKTGEGFFGGVQNKFNNMTDMEKFAVWQAMQKQSSGG